MKKTSISDPGQDEIQKVRHQLKQREVELSLINKVQEGIVNGMSMKEIYDLAGDRIRTLFDAQAVLISIFNHENRTEQFNYIFEDGQRLKSMIRPIDKLRQRLIETGDLICINENADEMWTLLTGEAPTVIPGTQLTKSALYVPMVIGQIVRGYLSLQNVDRENAFSDSDVRLLSTLAKSLSIALENARLFNETEQRNAELAVINSVQEGLVAEMDIKGIYDLVGDRIRELFDAQVTAIVTFNLVDKTEHWKYVFENGKRFPVSSRPIDKFREKIIKDRKTLLLNENASQKIDEFNGEASPAVAGTGDPKSAMYVPMVVGDAVRGYVTLQNIDRENAFSESDVSLLNTLINSMSVALENARLFNETEQQNAELAVINSVQQGLVAEMDMQGIYNLVGDRIRELFDAQVTGIYTFDKDSQKEIFQYLYEDGKRFFPNPRPLDKVRKWIIKNCRLLLINENIDDTIFKLTGERPKPVDGTRMPKSLVFIPLMVGDEIRGWVSLQNLDRENAFNESAVRLLSTLANSMSVALENARLFNETEQRNAELAVINSVQQGLVAEMDMQGIYDLVGDRIRNLFNSQVTAISTFDPEEKTEDLIYVFEEGKRHFPGTRPIDNFRKKILKDQKTILINENAYQKFSEINKSPMTAVAGTRAPKSALFVPMLVGDSVRGYVALQNLDIEYAFSDSDVRLLNTLVNSMSVALENARLFNETTRLLAETEQRATELHTVNRISLALVSQLEFKALIKLIGDQMRETFNADIVYLALYDPKTNILDFPYMYGDKPKSRTFGNGITEKIILNREPLLVNQDLDETYDRIAAERSGKWVESYLGVPIIAGKEAIGVISVQSTAIQNRFSEYDLRLLTTIAANVGVAMQNAEAYRKLQAALTDLKSAQEQLVQQEKLASLGQLTAGIAHEIKNPLNFVNNFSDLNVELIDEVFEELRKLPKNESVEEIILILLDVKSNLKKIHQHGTRADSIVKSMLQHSRGGSGKVEPTDLNTLIREYVNLSFHGMRAGKKAINVSIDLKLDENVGMVPLIGEDFSRVILNLCNNAFDAMREKQKDDTGNGAYLAKLTVRTSADNGQVQIEVEDNGPGIPEDHKDKILQPFFTTKKGTEGTGLGLSITHDIIKAHMGTLEIDSKKGAFTRFKILIPNNTNEN